MFRDGSTNAELLQLLKDSSPGGALKPDMLGIAAGRQLEFDMIEVGTVKTAKSTFDELEYKAGVLLNHIVPELKLSLLPDLALRYRARFVSLMVPTEFSVRGSAFRLSSWEATCPLPVRLSGKGEAATVDWICFHPSTTWKSPKAPPTTLPGTGTDGLLIYHIHRAPIPKLPAKIRSYLEQELAKWKRQSGLVLELNPALAFAQSKSDWDPRAKQYLAYMGAGAVLLMFLAVAWELGVVAGGVALAEEGLIALASAPEALGAALRGGIGLAGQLWPAIVPMVPYFPTKL